MTIFEYVYIESDNFLILFNMHIKVTNQLNNCSANYNAVRFSMVTKFKF